MHSKNFVSTRAGRAVQSFCVQIQHAVGASMSAHGGYEPKRVVPRLRYKPSPFASMCACLLEASIVTPKWIEESGGEILSLENSVK